MKKYIHSLIVLLLMCSLEFSAHAQLAKSGSQPNSGSLEKEEHLLNGTSFTFQYQNAGAIDITFDEGQLTYKWVAGRNLGEPAKTYAYKSRKIDSDVYLVNWHETDSSNFVTMVYNFKSNACAVSVISNYKSDKPFLGFQAGIIEHVNRR